MKHRTSAPLQLPVQTTAWAAQPALLKCGCNKLLISALYINQWIKYSPPVPNLQLEAITAWLHIWLTKALRWFHPNLPLTIARHGLCVGSTKSPCGWKITAIQRIKAKLAVLVALGSLKDLWRFGNCSLPVKIRVLTVQWLKLMLYFCWLLPTHLLMYLVSRFRARRPYSSQLLMLLSCCKAWHLTWWIVTGINHWSGLVSSLYIFLKNRSLCGNV